MINIGWKLVFIMVMLDFFQFICEIGVSGFTLPLSVKLVNSRHFNNAAKQLTKEKVIIDH